MQNSPALRAEGVSCSYDGLQAVRNVTLEVPRGAFYGLIGPNGAGKSTLLDCISGVNVAYEGRVFVGGEDVTRLPLQRMAERGLGRTFQTARVFRRMSVMSNLMVAARHPVGESLAAALTGTWKSDEARHLERAWSILQFFDLIRIADNWGSELSGGQERLIELSRLLMSNPQVVLLDEPFAGVSPVNRAKLASQLRQLSMDTGVTILMVEHRLEWIENLCERVFVMAEGKLIAQGSLAELRSHRAVIDSYLGAPTR
ncbi:MAG TPA: ABC transporter ATP-binding protein [Candidatus Acidoferrum sp.]|jgi:ABC-type branched-subunit amino acid transport system ATPase component|nr:ABC transporter ATP-binding protein [Candidatus Acidoferrum sp.]